MGIYKNIYIYIKHRPWLPFHRVLGGGGGGPSTPTLGKKEIVHGKEPGHSQSEHRHLHQFIWLVSLGMQGACG